jgi:glycerate dehydrogenase
LSAAIIDKLPRLKFIAVTATGYNIVDVAAARSRDIPVSNVPDYGTFTVAQYTMSLVLALCHHVETHAYSVAAGEWASSPHWCYWKTPQVELQSRILGIVGFGRIGKRVAELGHAFGMKVLYASHQRSEELTIPAEQVSVEKLFQEADVISLHCALTPENRGFIHRERLRSMKRTAFLINTARGQLVDEADLAAALREQTIAGAALDVLSEEPPSPSNPLLYAPNCLITPHIAWSTLPARQRILQATVANIGAFLSGAPINVLN